MNYSRQRYTILLLFYGLMISGSQSSLVSVPIILLGDSEAGVTILAFQNGEEQSRADENNSKLKFDPNSGMVNIESAYIHPWTRDITQRRPVKGFKPLDELVGKKLYFSVRRERSESYKTTVWNYYVSYERYEYLPSPSKKKIRAYKTVDLNDDWTVLITDSTDKEEISKSTFKKNTDRFAKSLQVRLNPIEIIDIKDSKIRYNSNIVKVFKGKKVTTQPLFSTPIKYKDFQSNPKSELAISTTEAKFVPAGQEPK